MSTCRNCSRPHNLPPWVGIGKWAKRVERFKLMLKGRNQHTKEYNIMALEMELAQIQKHYKISRKYLHKLKMIYEQERSQKRKN